MKRTKREKLSELIPFERSQKVIRLEKRGPERKSHTISALIFGILGIAGIIYCIGIALAGFGTYFFTIWGVIGAFFLLISALMFSPKIMALIPKWIKLLCTTVFFLGMLLFCVIEGLIFTKYHAIAAPGADFCIVLGAQWKSNGPSEVLRRRLDKAASYLTENPETKVIVSGGQGSNEIITEAAGMREYLINAGISQERILMEDSSSNTYENLIYSSRYLDKENDSVVIVTNNFHVFRALKIAQKQGYSHVEGLAASSVSGMAPNNLLREFLGIIKDFIVGNL